MSFANNEEIKLCFSLGLLLRDTAPITFNINELISFLPLRPKLIPNTVFYLYLLQME